MFGDLERSCFVTSTSRVYCELRATLSRLVFFVSNRFAVLEMYYGKLCRNRRDYGSLSRLHHTRVGYMHAMSCTMVFTGFDESNSVYNLYSVYTSIRRCKFCVTLCYAIFCSVCYIQYGMPCFVVLC